MNNKRKKNGEAKAPPFPQSWQRQVSGNLHFHDSYTVGKIGLTKTFWYP
jgi:hypothetical protein